MNVAAEDGTTLPLRAIERAQLAARDRDDPLAHLRAAFDLPGGVIYLDGNSLGPLGHGVRERLHRVIDAEWGRGLIAGWTESGWMDLPRTCGDKVARLIGARPGEVVVTDSTSVDLFKALSLALAIDPRRHVLLSDRGNFPTDLYIASGLVDHLGGRHELLLVDSTEEAIESALASRGDEVAVLFLTHTHFTTARIWDMARLTRAAHAAGAVVAWDLSHSAGAMPIDLNACEADFAVGCGYKYLNGGPGAPAYLYVASRHQHLRQPITGWMGDAAPFEFRARYEPAPGIERHRSGTPPILSMAAFDAALDVMLAADMAAVRAKSVALGELFINLMDEHCPDLALLSPRDGTVRGSHVSYRHTGSVELMRALAADGVVGDCRPPDILRFGLAPLYVRYVDAWDAVMRLAAVLRHVR